MVCAAVLVIRSVLLMPVSAEKATDSAVVLLGVAETTVVALLLTMTLPSLMLTVKVVVAFMPVVLLNTSACNAACAALGATEDSVYAHAAVRGHETGSAQRAGVNAPLAALSGVMVTMTAAPTSGSVSVTLENGCSVPPAVTACDAAVPPSVGASLTDVAVMTVAVLAALAGHCCRWR
jgi:hypothetical protein